MKTAKLGTVFMVSVMALAAIGVGYSHWTDEIDIKVKADMGRLGIGYTHQYTNDPDGTLDPDQPEGRPRQCGEDLPPANPGKDVADTTCRLLEPKKWHDGTPMLHNRKTCYNLIEVNLTNVYPNYAPNLYFNISNAGTIPVDLVGFWIIDGPPGVNPQDETTWLPMVICTMYKFDLDGDGVDDTEIGVFNESELTGPQPKQIDPCETKVYGLSFHILQEFPQCETHTFKFKIRAWQWNWPILPP
jgi:hypothetical protein